MEVGRDEGNDMSERIQFREKLSGILEIAQEQGKRITTQEVEKYFEEDQLSEEQLTLVFDYLLAQKTVVKGYVKKGGAVTDQEEIEKESLTAEEQKYLEEYEHDLASLPKEKEGEKKKLWELAVAGDALSKSRLIELYLPEVVVIAKEMNCKELFLGDLVQEGNVSLMLAMDMLTTCEDAQEQLFGEIRAGIQALKEEQNELKQQDRRMVEQVNRLDEGVKALTEDMGRKVTVEELAEYMELSEEDVLDIMKLAGEELEEEPETEI